MSKIMIKKLSEDEIEQRKMRTWPIWEKEVSTFNWEYEGDEECLILEGRVKVETPEGEYNISEGDFVTFKDGLKCKWNIIKPIKKHYNFP